VVVVAGSVVVASSVVVVGRAVVVGAFVVATSLRAGHRVGRLGRVVRPAAGGDHEQGDEGECSAAAAHRGHSAIERARVWSVAAAFCAERMQAGTPMPW
jgi:hypothetical protein